MFTDDAIFGIMEKARKAVEITAPIEIFIPSKSFTSEHRAKWEKLNLTAVLDEIVDILEG